ncbi:MAG: hypothetical protein HY014_02075, partial [Acidobacteria bacterium]|nr:hypothetical protein [Acidobacteriota bacterium]MBI3486935.1 hypothetical protein [Acidobacteriota bacterium]
MRPLRHVLRSCAKTLLSVLGGLVVLGTASLATPATAQSTLGLRTLSTLLSAQIPAAVEISGPWTNQYGGAIELYQVGASVQGTYVYGSTTYTVTGTVSGYVFSGSLTSGSLTYPIPGMTISPDGLTISGAITNWSSSNTWTRQSGIVLRLSPTASRIAKAGDVLTYAAEVGGNLNKSVSWSTTAGAIVDGIYTVPSGYDYTAQTITVTANADPAKKLSTQVSILPPSGQFELSGSWKNQYGGAIELYQTGTSVQGTYVYGSTTYTVTGTVSGYTFSGSLTSGSLTYPIPGMTISPDGLTISGAITNWSSSNTWTRQSGIVLRLSPTASRIAKAGDTLTYTAQVGGSLDKSVTWSATAGNIVGGIYTVPSGYDYTSQGVTVTANADGTKKVTALVAVTPTGVIEVSGMYSTSAWDLLLFQNGTDIQGDWYTDSSGWGQHFLVKGTLDGFKLLLTYYNAAYPNGAGTMNLTFAPDGKSF